jgi:hypothetical protein
MDGLEDRVRRALGAGALAADPSLVDVDAVHAGIATRRRRRFAVVATVAVVGLLGAGGAFALNQHDTKPSTSAVLSVPTPTVEPTVEPTVQPTPSPEPTPTVVPECRTGDIAMVSATTEGAAGHLYTDVIVRNLGPAPCVLSDSPGISFSGNGGPDTVRHDGSVPADGRTPAVLARGAAAHVTLDAQNGCNGGMNPTVFNNLKLVLKDGGTLDVPAALESSCPLLVTNWYLLP